MDPTQTIVDSSVSMENVVFPWFALRVKSNFEVTSSIHLRDRGFEQYVPSYKVDTRWSDRKKVIEKPLFPGYVFCRMNPQDRLPVISAPGVLSAVGFGKTPAPIPEHEIEAIRAILSAGLKVKPWPFLQVGQRVLIQRGALEGVEGILLRFKKTCRVVVSITLLQRSISAEVDEDMVRPISTAIVHPPAKAFQSKAVRQPVHLGKAG